MRMRNGTGAKARLLATAALAFSASGVNAQQATDLDEIVVSGPSPIVAGDRPAGPPRDLNGVMPVATDVFVRAKF